MYVGCNVLGECFFEPRRSRKHDINLLEETAIPGQLERNPTEYFTFLSNERMTSR